MLRHPLFRPFCLALLLLLCVPGQTQELAAIPPLHSRVTDLAGMLTPQERHALETTLRDYEAAKGSQIAILLVNSTEPETIAQYSIRVVDAWKLGRKGVDDGVLLLVAKNNPPGLNRLRIESGRGTEGVLTDIQSKRILQDVIAPYFRKNDFYGGLSAGVSAIIATLNHENFAPPEKQGRGGSGAGGWLPLLFMLAFILIVLRSRIRGRGHGGALLTGIILGNALGRRRRYDDFDDFGGGGFGGGGFSGGGGGFSGGGASGNW
ncbi:MAG: TPM domain-containing protein [Burkholderiaceae bacterium]|jgi:uncharacterized protein|nr:TPM domain-containing protein [Burkholderiaceae bacterium]